MWCTRDRGKLFAIGVPLGTPFTVSWIYCSGIGLNNKHNEWFKSLLKLLLNYMNWTGNIISPKVAWRQNVIRIYQNIKIAVFTNILNKCTLCKDSWYILKDLYQTILFCETYSSLSSQNSNLFYCFWDRNIEKQYLFDFHAHRETVRKQTDKWKQSLRSDKCKQINT